jgi:hypothetical protein
MLDPTSAMIMDQERTLISDVSSFLQCFPSRVLIIVMPSKQFDLPQKKK